MVECGAFRFIHERSHSVGYGFVETSVERSEFVCIDFRSTSNSQLGDRLAHVSVMVYDLIHPVSESK